MRATQEQIDRETALLGERRTAYTIAFGGAAGALVLADLAKFCRANETCFHEDPRLHAALEGRRECWLRIQNTLNLTPEEQFALYAPPVLIVAKEQTDG